MWEIFLFPHGLPTLMGLGSPLWGSLTHLFTPHLVWLLWTSDKPLTTHNTHKRQTYMPPAGFKFAIPASKHPHAHALRWVHTCNITVYCNAITSQVTDTMRSYDLNFHPVPHGITVACERFTMGFPVCYGSQKHHECKEGERSGRWWHVTSHVQTCSCRNRIIPLMPRTNTDRHWPCP
jgi:hypothetical protein